MRVEFANDSAVEGWVEVTQAGEISVEVPAEAGTSNSGYAGLKVDGTYSVTCHAGPTTIAGPELSTT